jgi:hypothetical protein
VEFKTNFFLSEGKPERLSWVTQKTAKHFAQSA